jgi:arsenate reductase
MTEDMMRVLVLCTGNSCRSQMAAGWLNALYGDRMVAFSAGSSPAGYVHPRAVEVMAETGVDLSGARSKHLEEFLGQRFEYVLTVCDSAAEACPVFPGPARRFHRDFFDPALAQGSNEEVLTTFRRVRDEIREWLGELFEVSAAAGSGQPGR